MGFFDNIRLGSALKAVGRAAKYIHNGMVGTIKNIHPLIRMYYDSDLGSPIEGHVEKSIASATCKGLKRILPNWKWSKDMCDSVGTWVAHKTVQALDASKVVYQVSNGILNKNTNPYKEIAKRTTAGLFSVSKMLCRVGHGIGWLIGKISDGILSDEVNGWIKKGLDVVIGETLRGVRKNVFSEKNKELVTTFIEHGMRVAVTATRGIVDTIDSNVDIIKDDLKKKESFIKEIADKVGDTILPFKKKVLDKAKNIGSAVKNIGTKVWNWITRRK